MIKKLKPKSEFSRNVLTLMTGTTIAQAIPIAISPILTRIYSPDDFGVFALFIAISSIFTVVANGRYELAIMLPKKDEDAINIVALGFIIACCLSLFVLFMVISFHDVILRLLKNKDIGVWLYFIPIVILLAGIFNLLTYWNIRKKNYKDLAKANIIKAIALSIIQLIVGFISQGASGLISGQITSQFFANSKLLININKDKSLLPKIHKLKIMALAKRYRSFPMYSMPGAISNILARQFINILISMFYSVTTLGYYSLIQKVLGIPSALIGNSVGQVFFQQAANEKQKIGSSILTFNSTLKKLILIGFPIHAGLYFYIEDLFPFVFGEEWKIAGTYSKIIIPLSFISFVSSSLSTTYDIYNKLKIELVWQIFLLAGATFIIIILKNKPFIIYLYTSTAFFSFMYILSLFITYKLAKGDST